ncbi:MAG TPA: protein translocase subunit SecF [Candidatus Tectomicrobia bacterium]|nr:protein translocase subunit SecF [Candidatus Tectomicrobia bacterium]
MIELFRNPSYDFIGKRRWAYLASALFILLGLASLVSRGGLRYDIDFSGGTLVQVRFAQPPQVARIRAALEPAGLGEAIIQEYGDPHEYILRLGLGTASAEEITRRIRAALEQGPGLGPFEVRRVEFVGPQVGRDLQLQALYAVIAGVIGILLYIALRFDLKGGVAAIIAVVHDVLVSIGALSLTDREFSLPVLAAILTIIGYSVNDTIVAYDRLRENRGRGMRGIPFAEQINRAINQTLSRTVLTALTTFFATAVLLFFGGKVLEDFAFALFVGVITGAYSTIYIAGALIVDWTQWVEGRVRRGKKAVAKA